MLRVSQRSIPSVLAVVSEQHEQHAERTLLVRPEVITEEMFRSVKANQSPELLVHTGIHCCL